MPKKHRQELSSVVAKTMARNTCIKHHQPIKFLSLENLKLGCDYCCFDKCMSIQQAVKNPIEIALGYLRDDQNQSMEHIKNLREKDDLCKVKIGFQTIIESISKRVNQLCKSLLQDFNRKWSQNLGIIEQQIQQITKAEQHYRSVFEQLLQIGLQKGTITQLQNLFKQFCEKSSQDPTDYLKSRLQSIINTYQVMPVINWNGVKQLYTTITDPNLWVQSSVFHSSTVRQYLSINDEQTAQVKVTQNKINLLLPGEINKLKYNKYCVKYDHNSLILFESLNEESREIINLKIGYDSLYEIDKCRLVGINYEGFIIYRYAFGTLEIEQSYAIKACQNLLVFPQCFIVEAEGRIMRIWLADKYKQVISLSGNNLNYTDNKFQFCFINSKGEIIMRTAYHDQF